MKKEYLFLLLAFFSSLGIQLKAQERFIYDQYHFNYYLINPAVAGANECSHVMLTTKNNWVGLEGPSTQALSYRTRLKTRNIGLGGYIYNDRTPSFSNMGAQFTFAYHIPLSNGYRYSRKLLLERQLSFAVSLKAYQLAYSGHNTNDPADVPFSEFVPNANFGAYFISYGFFAGLSATNLIPYSLQNTGLQEPIGPTTAFFFAGYTYKLAPKMYLEPSLNFNYDAYNNKQIELNCKFTENGIENDFGYWLQLSYRHNIDPQNSHPLSVIPIIGIRTNKLQLAYAYNVPLNGLALSSYGTHELMLAYTFCVPTYFCR